MTQGALVRSLLDMETVAERIKRLREAAELSMDSLAKLCGLSWQAVQQWETGKTAPRRKIQPLAAKALGVSVPYLMCLTDDE